MRDLNYQLKQLCHRNRDGSFATQADRERLLNLCANDLAERGFQHMSVDSLKPKHVAARSTSGSRMVSVPERSRIA